VEELPRAASFPLAFAALLHAAVAPVVEDIADRLRLSGAEKSLTIWLVDLHATLDRAPVIPVARLKTLLVQPDIADLIALHRARALARSLSLGAANFCETVLRDTPTMVLNPPPLLTGEDLIATGLKPGPEFKRIIDAVREAQLEGRVKTKEEAIEMARNLANENGETTK
jgi:poly(A) polymerase